MKLKKIVLILLLTLALFSISSVSAQNIDVNTTNNINPLNEVLIDETIATSNELTNKSSIISNDLEKYYKDDKGFCATFYNENGTPLTNKNITFSVNGVSYIKTTDNNGTAKLNINLESGNYTIISYNPTTNETITNNITVLSSINGNDLTKYFKNATQYSVTLYDKTGKALVNKTVRFNINGIFYERKTNEKGVAQLNINLDPGNYIVTVYNLITGEEKSNNINVVSRIQLLDLNNASNVILPGGYVIPVMFIGNGKAYAQCRATTLDEKGNPLANQLVTFNINGIIYKGTTDKFGIIDAIIYVNADWGNTYHICTATFGESFASQTVIVKRFVMG